MAKFFISRDSNSISESSNNEMSVVIERSKFNTQSGVIKYVYNILNMK